MTLSDKDMDGMIRRLDTIDPAWRDSKKWDDQSVTPETRETYKKLIEYEISKK